MLASVIEEFEFATPKRVTSTVPGKITELSEGQAQKRYRFRGERLQIRTKPDERRAEMCGCIIAKFFDLR